MTQKDAYLPIEDIRKKAISLASDLQPWENYFSLRAKEAEAILSVFDIPRQGLALEIGCSNGFNSCLLSYKFRRIIATDLFKQDFKTHTQALLDSKKLLESLDITNCSILSCSGEELPFKDGTFDVVFSLNTLEHIPDRKKTAQEMNRVLKKGGLAIIVVPSFLDRIFYPLVYYRDMLARAIGRFLIAPFRKPDAPAARDGGASSKAGSSSVKEFLTLHPNFPFPEPHGAYKTLGHEFAGYLPGKWLGLFTGSGFRIKKVFSTIVIPWQLLSLINPALPFKVYEKTVAWNSRVGAKYPFKYLGSNLCMIVQKI